MQIYNFLKFNICEMSQREEWKFDCVLKLKYHLSIWTGFCHVTDVQQKFNNFSRDRNSFANIVLDIWVDWKYYASNIANERNWFPIDRGIISFSDVYFLFVWKPYTYLCALQRSVKMEKKLALLSFIHRNQFHKLNVGLDLFYRTVTVTGQCTI